MHSIEEIQTAFSSLVPVLSKRIWHYAKRFSDGDESFTEMFATCWINFRQKALKGVLLPPHKLAFIAFIRLASGRTLTGYSVADALAPAAFKNGTLPPNLFVRVDVFARQRFAAGFNNSADRRRVVYVLAISSI